MFKNKVFDIIFVAIRRCIYGVLYTTHFMPLRKNKIVILCYHSIGDDLWRYTVSFKNLQKQMAYMLKNYEPITLETVEKYISGQISIDTPSFVVTFDDGYADIMQTKEYFASLGVKPTVFVLGDSDKANKAVMESDRPFLSVDQIKELHGAGWGIGCHTMTHNDLTTLKGEDVLNEVVTSKTMLEEELGMEVPYIAYPLGRYTKEVLENYDIAGYRMGLSMDDSRISTNTDICIVPRVGVDGSHTFIEFVATISDTIIFLRSLVKKVIAKKDSTVIRSKNRKVDVIVRYFWPVVAGTEINILQTYSVLAKEGWDVTIHTSQDTLLEKNTLPLSEVYRGLWIRRYVFKLFGFWPRVNWKKTDIIALHNFNIVPFYWILFYTLLLKTFGRKRFTLILVPHGGFVLHTKHLPWLRRLAIPLFYYIIGVPLINLTVDGIRNVSNWEKQEMLRKGINQKLLHVIPNGTEPDAYADVDRDASDSIRRQVKECGDYIIQMGRIEPVKNYETTIRALKFLPKHVNYIIVGPTQDVAYKQYLDTLIESEGMGSRVFFVGVVHGVDKYYLLKHARLMSHMSIWESYCNAVHEGLSQGLVCVVSNATGLPELVQEGSRGYCIDPYDYETLGLRINTLLSLRDSAELNIITERNSKGVRLRSWSDVARDFARMVVSAV